MFKPLFSNKIIFKKLRSNSLITEYLFINRMDKKSCIGSVGNQKNFSITLKNEKVMMI